MQFMNTFVDLNISPRLLLGGKGDTVLNAAHDLVLQTNGTHGSIILEGSCIACVVFVSGRDVLPEVEVSEAYSDGNMIVDESDSNIDISFFVKGGVFNYVIEKSAIDDILYFELDRKKFTLSKKQLLKVE